MTLGLHWDVIPQAVGGSNTTYYCDGVSNAAVGEQLLVGGGTINKFLCGLSAVHLSTNFNTKVSDFGARLAFYGNPTIVSGSELMAM